MKIFADGADIKSIKILLDDPLIEGFTTNPTLMKQAGVIDYMSFSREVISLIGERPISLEVFSDDLDEMFRQALLLSSLGTYVYVKIPVTTTTGTPTTKVIKKLSDSGVKVNVTAVFTTDQVEEFAVALAGSPAAYVSVFAGRIADAGIDPVPTIVSTKQILSSVCPTAEVIWASPREVFNLVQARDCGCDVITMTPDLLKKVPSLGKSLEKFSLETVQMFFNDASAAGYVL